MARLINFFDGAESSTTPTIGNIVASNLVQYPDDAAFEAAESGSPTTGNLYYNTTLNLIRYYNGTEWINVVDETSAQTIENKTVDGTSATGNNTVTTDADQVTYDPSGSSLTATDDQAALDEVAGRLDTAEGRITVNEGDIDDLETLSGSPGSTDHGAFTGATIPDNSTTKDALQSLETEVELKLNASEKGAANGVAELDGSGLVPATQLPSYVDDVEEYADLAAFPVTGETGKIYVALDTNKTYRWSGATYIEVSASDVTTVNGQTGAVVLDTDDITEGSSNEYYTDAKVDARIGAASVDDLSDVDTSTIAPTDGQALVWNSVDGEFQPGDVATAGGGDGGKNYLAEVNFNVNKEDASGWVPYNDGNPYVDGTGGTVIALSVGTTDSSLQLLEGDFSVLLSKTTDDATGEGVSALTQTIDRQDFGRTLNGSLEIDFTDANYTAGDIAIKAFDVTNSVELPVVGDLVDGLPKLKGKVQFQVLPRVDTEQVRISLHVVNDGAVGSTWEVSFDSVKLGPDTLMLFNSSGPIGEIIASGSADTPDGFLYCDGSAVSRTTYGELFEVIGTNFGIGDNTTTFNLPDLRGQFLRGQDDGALEDPDSAGRTPSGLLGNSGDNVGSKQGHIFGSHNHGGGNHTHTSSTAFGGAGGPYYPRGETSIVGSVTGGASGNIISTQGGNETRPKNVYVRYYIRYKSKSNVLSTTETLLTNAVARYTASLTTGLSITPLRLNFSSKDFDTSDNVTTGASWVYTAKETGKYKVNISVPFENGNTPNRIDLELFKNGSLHTTRYTTETIGSAVSGVMLDEIVHLNSNDTIYAEISNTVNNGTNMVDVRSINVQQLPDFSAFSVYGETDLVESETTMASYPFAPDQWGDLVSITLRPGEWDIDILLSTHNFGAVTSGVMFTGAGIVSGNVGPGSEGPDYLGNWVPGTSSIRTTLPFSKKGVILTEPTTYYMKTYYSALTANLLVYGKISARKIK